MPAPLADFLVAWRTTMVRDREIIDALVQPAHRGPSRDLQQVLDAWQGYYAWMPSDGEGRLLLVRANGRDQPERWWLHVGLFLVTFLTVAASGALLDRVVPSALGLPGTWSLDAWGAAAASWFHALRPGIHFAMALMGILLAHECGHYFVAKRYFINASPPYFLPAPPWPWLSLIGTFGAFIRLRSPVVDRRQLMDVGAAGPWAGFVISVVLLMAGLSQSELLPASHGDAPFMVFFLGNAVALGDCLVTQVLRLWLVGEGTVLLDPLALAGWVGVFVTMLNLLPLGQLDGGHILYALIGNRQRTVGKLMWLSLIPLGFAFGGWWVWAFLILLLSRGRFAHPSVLDRYRAVPGSRKVIGWATVLLFTVTFTPVPFYL